MASSESSGMSQEDIDDGNGEGLSAAACVISTPELLDKICSFLRLDALFRLRLVSHSWRLASSASLKRRLHVQVNKRSRRSVDVDLVEDELAFKFKDFERNSFTSQNAKQQEALKSLSADAGLWLEFKMSSCENSKLKVLLVTILSVDLQWPVTRMTISCFKELKEWNCVGPAILKTFPKLKLLRVSLTEVPGSSEGEVPLCFSELKRNVGLLNNDYEPTFALEHFDFDAEIKYHSTQQCPWFTFLEHCPNLKEVRVSLRYPNSTGTMWYSSSRSCGGASSSLNELTIRGRTVQEDQKAGARSHRLSDFTELTRVLPNEPCTMIVQTVWLNSGAYPCIHPKLLQQVQRLRIRDYSYVPRVSRMGFQTLINHRHMPNLRKLECELLCWRTNSKEKQECKPKIKLGLGRGLKNVEILHFRGTCGILGWETKKAEKVFDYMWPDLSEAMPNVKVLVLHADRCFAVTSSLKAGVRVLESLPRFKKLKHLVLVSRHGCYRVREETPCELSREELTNLGGLSSISLIVQSIPTARRYIDIVVNACVAVGSIGKLGVYTRIPGRVDALSQLLETHGLTLGSTSGGMVVETGDVTSFQGNMIFDDVEESHIPWADIMQPTEEMHSRRH